MKGHTPGPWVVYDCRFDDKSGVWYRLSNVQTLCAADARLIAAAPDLLAELKFANGQMALVAECIEAGRYDEALLHVRSMSRTRLAAIAKATGETK
ncbi:hypothetical protein LF41_2394 [Lysobacter dokdonensis DS-58]|uniref:Uncharacterized protein n=1 Tax=Lysobacter dokdonensis DS-58 TaxID=1300345 RepID=A0A0A2WMC2_9GAMM|nr:hypothetical protein [Lysobacter dokdonensis]KGQ19887.1 hypothetical protein LF41_2394 [Lysobacter dokdonensis DS-58]